MKKYKLSEIVILNTGKLDSNQAKKDGLYPFFTCSPETLFINNYAFDCEAVLLAGNNANAVYPIKYYKGKFNAYQRTYVITAKDANLISLRWFYFKLKSIIKKIAISSSGTATKFLTKKILDNYEIDVPNIIEQTKISDFLWGLENKITLNTQTNQTLEQIAQAIFKHWFIDFAPVHAKANALARGETIEQAELAAMACLSGKTAEKITALKTQDPTAYHQLQQTAAAFPSEFVETEMGEVPKGWGYKFLNEVCKIAYGKNLPTKQLLDQGYPVFGGNGIIGYFDRYLYEQPQTLISCRGAASGKIMYSAPKSFITNNSLIIESNELLDYFYIYEYLKNKDITPYISGSAQPQITISSIEKIKILLPQEFILNRYSSLVSSLYNKIYLNNKNNELLAKTRDQLLPKLLNGEVEL
ncbi:restriction endonuclease subunit S [Gallibacterium anatis]|uniref:restriction endonuclease subunit S n=1 Tax=Gallibacterium anatis TaxID=750 RepID=UPI002551806A|nr:restriction endonuclease subunit S [Gallibacterium anatis]MDK9561269.1 restriction endonuclease subunit S [Gallibacterium anatis]